MRRLFLGGPNHGTLEVIPRATPVGQDATWRETLPWDAPLTKLPRTAFYPLWRTVGDLQVHVAHSEGWTSEETEQQWAAWQATHPTEG